MTLKSYPFLRIALFFISGISLPFLYPVAVWAILVIAAIALALFLGGNILKSTLFSATGMYVALICAGSLIASYKLQKSPLPFPEQTQAYTVRIKSATESKPKSYKVIAEVISIRTPDRWQSSGSEVLLYFQKTDAPPPVYGDVFLIHDAPREIEGPKNPLEFDYKSFQERRGIKTHHFLRDSDYVRLGHKPEYPWMSAIYNWNRAAGETLRERISSSDDAGIAEAMLTGTRDHIETELNTAYASTGSVHVLAVSGMHVGIILLILRFLLKPLRNLPGGRFYFGIISNLIIWLYAVFTGLSPSVVRATFMFSLFEMGSMFHQRRNSINILAASAVILLIFKPAWLFEVGFQLSYLAIFGILFLYEPLRSLFEPKYKLIKWFWEITVVSIAAQVFTLPLILYYFHQIPNYSLLSNPLVAVGSTLVLGSGIPAVLLSKIPFLGDMAAFILIWTLKIMNFSVKYIANLPHATSTGFSIGLIEVFMLFLLVFLLSFLFLKKEFRLLPVILFLSGSLFIYNMIQDLGQMKQKEITYHFIPRGSGISLIDSKEALFLCDSITEINPRAYSFHLKNYYDDRGIRTYSTKKPADSSQILAFEFSGSRNLWIKARNYRQIKERFDRVMISNNAVWQIDRQFEIFPDQIILDDTNSRKRISSLKAQADSLGIELIALYDTGGITFTY